ncbi:MAG: SDR family NAD(P)-dependent oxidoreductase [Proteobacteria bacterium]|nr:MAG: SDR family NAD(P)-dependent oxidoreductase [Pseudomonadota bacterium]
MGPAIAELFSEAGADVVAHAGDLRSPGAADALVAETGCIDVLIANFAGINPRTSVGDTTDAQWHEMFDVMVHPLQRLTRAIAPQMITRRAGKIIVIGSASALKGMPNWSAYSAARGAQLAFVRAVGVELAPMNIQVNAIAQSFVDNPDYFSTEYQRTAEFAQRIAAVPAGRLASGREGALAALFLASDESDFFVGQVFPFSGGWIA